MVEKALVRAREEVAVQEQLAKEVAHRMVARQARVRQEEEAVWRRRLEQLLKKVEEGPEQFQGPGSPTRCHQPNISPLHQLTWCHQPPFHLLPRFSTMVRGMALEYQQARGAPLTDMAHWFEHATRFLREEEMEAFNQLKKLMLFANKMLAEMAAEEEEEEDEVKELDRELEAMTEEKRVKVAKFKDIVKEDVRERFSDILREVSEELELPGGEVEQEEAMQAMADTLDQLVAKLAGSSEQVEGVRRQVEDIKAAAADTTDLKRDGKRSVKKELRDEEDEEIFGSDSEDDDLDATIAETRKKLVAMKAEADQLEKEVKTSAKATDNVKVSVTKMGLGEEVDAEQAATIAKRLEGTIKDKLAKLGIDTGNRPIEVNTLTLTLVLTLLLTLLLTLTLPLSR